MRGYSWEACWDDYRNSVATHLTTPAQRWRRGLDADIWWPHLERGLCAFEDLRCADLVAP